MMDGKQHISIFTTASLPWMTGTAINPLFRAAYLAKDGNRKVTLVIPWLCLDDQETVYPNKIIFRSPMEQEEYVRHWLEDRINFNATFAIHFYTSKYCKELGSIIATGDLTESISDEEADVAVLEEPEHLTWYHHGQRWKSKFRRVIGVVHTNYLGYVKKERNGYINAFILKIFNNWVTRIYCHKIIRLSAATQDFPRSTVCNVHGVNPKFISIGLVKQDCEQGGEQVFTKGAYYIGKMVWSKGYRELIHLLKSNQKKLTGFEMDLYGSGPDTDEVQQTARKVKLKVGVHPGRDHADPLFHDYKVFINPSTTDVVCTTTAEALAMGKIVVCAKHPSNDFFKQFRNCRMYDNSHGFVEEILKALSEEPAPLTDEERNELSWESATERFLEAADLDKIVIQKPLRSTSWPLMSLSLKTRDFKKKIEDVSAKVHHKMTGNEKVRRTFGAIPGSLQPDEQQCKDLGIPFPVRKKSFKQ